MPCGGEIIDILNRNQIVVYGVGYIAKRFYNALKHYNLERNVICFITSSGEGEEIDGVPVERYSHDTLNKDALVCVAVHDSIKDPIIDKLKTDGIYYVWIYPFIFEMEYGKPRRVERDVDLLWSSFPDEYSLAVRWLVIDQINKQAKTGDELYIKIYGALSSNETAMKRLESFYQLIHDFSINGYNDLHPVSINLNGEILDGIHRVALSKYFAVSRIMCKEYSTYKTPKEEHGQLVLDKEILSRRCKLRDSEITLLREVYRNASKSNGL